MPNRSVKILSTKLLNEDQVIQLNSGFELEHFDLLEIEELETDITDCADNVIFTSYKGAEIGLRLLGDEAVGKRFFCVGEKTRELVRMLELDLIVSKPYSNDLADYIIHSQASRNYSYLCNENRLDVLPNVLREAKLDCKEFITYRSNIAEMTAKEVQAHDIYMWFSPLGVKALASEILEENVLHVAIGETTASALIKEKIKSDKIIFPEIPSIKGMIELINSRYN